jgi:hypothetical protein
MDITNFNRDSLIKSGTDLLAGTTLASSLGITTTTSNLQQFYNRFGQAAVWKAEQLSYKINTSMFFEVSFNFIPENSTIKSLLKEALVQASEEDIKFFVQSVTIPAFTIDVSDTMFTEAGTVINPVDIVKAGEKGTQEITLSLLNTEYPLHEHVFYPWMREATLNFWAYEKRPHTIADITVHILESKTGQRLYSYILAGCYPTTFAAPTLSQEATTTMTRDVTFSFNNMYFMTNKKITGSVLNQLFDKFAGGAIKDKISVLKNKLPGVPAM